MTRPDKETRAIIDELDRFEKLMQLTKTEYEMYFMGVLKRPPSEKGTELKRIVHELTEARIINTAALFRFRVLKTRHDSLSLRWLRTVKQIEDGTYKGQRFMADVRDKERAKKAPRKSADEIRAEIRAIARGEDPGKAAAPANAERAAPKTSVAAPRGGTVGHAANSEQLFAEYVSARKSAGEAVGLDRAALERTLLAQADRIRAQLGVRDVKFRVVVEDGKSKVKAVPVK